MKKILGIIACLLSSVYLLTNCEDDPCDTIIEKVDSSFTIGIENESIQVTTFDSAIKLIAPFHDMVIFDIDIDDNGTDDIQLRSVDNFSPAGIMVEKSRIIIINPEYELSVIDMPDTMRRCTEIINDSLLKYTHYNNYSGYKCDDGIDTVIYITTYSYPDVYSLGDTLTDNEKWSNNYIDLAYYDHSVFYTIEYYKYLSIVRGKWNNQNMKYILFKKENNGQIRYGWLRLSIDNYLEIRFYEYAIQKAKTV